MGARKCSKSEYRRSFKSRLEECAQTYDNNVDYRFYRRYLESNHQNDPFDWPDSNDEVSDNGGDEFSLKRPHSVPLHKYKHMLFTKKNLELLQKQQLDAEKQLQQLQIKRNRTEEVSRPKKLKLKKQSKLPRPVPSPTVDQKLQDLFNNLDLEDKTTQVYTVPKQTEKKQTTTAMEGIATTKPGHNFCYKSPENQKHSETRIPRPKRPQTITPRKYRRPLPKPRPVSAPLGRTLKKDTAQAGDNLDKEKPPFLLFGFLDAERITGTKKTHNVRASTDIYPSAMRAQKRRELTIRMRKDQSNKLPLWQKRRISEFNAKLQRETASWDTEYRKSFSGFDESAYKSSSLMPKKLHSFLLSAR